MFQIVSPELVPEVWAQVEPGLEVIKRRCKAHWYPREIKTRLMEGAATLFLRPEGFVIVERCKEAITLEPYVNVWLMYFKPGEAMRLKDELVKWLDALKKFHRCAWWQFSSPREEWGATIAPFCDKTMVTWRRRT